MTGKSDSATMIPTNNADWPGLAGINAGPDVRRGQNPVERKERFRMKHIIYKRNIWTHETETIGTAPDSYTADRRSMRINEDLRRQGDTDHYSYFEPECGWNAATEQITTAEPGG